MTGAGLGFYVKGQLFSPLGQLGLGTEPSSSKRIESFPSPKDAIPAQTRPANPDPAVVAEPSREFTEPAPAELRESPLDRAEQELPNRPESQPSVESEALAQDPTSVPTPRFPDAEISPAPSLPAHEQDALDQPLSSPLSPTPPSTSSYDEALPLSPPLPEQN
jgi:hypothetical protein